MGVLSRVGIDNEPAAAAANRQPHIDLTPPAAWGEPCIYGRYSEFVLYDKPAGWPG